jgi:hypothetical protein
MRAGSRQSHQRAVTVAVAGILFGTLSQASLIDASIWTQSGTRSDLGLPVLLAQSQAITPVALASLHGRTKSISARHPPALPTSRVTPAFRSKSRIASLLVISN